MSAAPFDTIRLGLMPPQTGLVEMYGPEIIWAARIACAEINERGGLLGKSLELVIEDDGSLPQTAVPAAIRLAEEHRCSALIGNLLSNSRIAVHDQVITPRRLPYLNFSFYEGSIASRYFFHFAALPNQQIEKMIPLMGRRYGLKMYFAGNNYEWPRGSIDAAKRALEKIEGECVGEEYLPLGAKTDELHALLERVARSGADVFVPYFAGHDQLSVLNRFAEMGLKSHMAVVMGHYDEIMASRLAPQVREGFYSVNTYFMSADTAQNRRYLERLKKQPAVDGLWPEGNGVLTNFGEGVYVCVKAFADAVNMAGSTEPEALVDALEHVRINAPQGEVMMDPATHHAHVNTYLARCQPDGRFAIVQPFGQIPPFIPERYREQFDSALLHEPQESPIGFPNLPEMLAEGIHGADAASRILDIAEIAVITTDENGVITAANQTAATLFGYALREMNGMPVDLLLPPHFRKHHAELMQQFINSEEKSRRMGARGKVAGYRKDGTFFPIETTIAKFRSDNEWKLVVTIRDLTEEVRAEDELTHRATHDPLTGLPNRALICERIDTSLQRTVRHGSNVALLFIDLDGFKEINDSYGHRTGDDILKEVASRLLEEVRAGDTVARLAGDEFIILCEHVDVPSTISALAARVNETLSRPILHDATALFTTASIGITVGNGHTHTVEDMLRAADTAMYAAKDNGRNRWQFYSDSLQKEAEHRLSISNGLRSAIEKNELQLRFQPIVSTESGAIRGAELLLRWFPPQGEIFPGDFIPIAEMTGSIVPIGRWVFEQACLAERRWQQQFGPDAPYVSVNLSARQLSEAGLVDDFTQIIETTGAEPSRIVLEVTETSLMADIASNKAVLKQLTKLGMKTAVDDFGTGYSSLSQLLRMEVDTLKIDREFIDGMELRSDSRIVVSTICRMAKSLQLELVAEGVENEKQWDILRTFGCDFVQGYFFYRPMEEQPFVDRFLSNLQQKEQRPERVHYLIYISRVSQPLDPSQLHGLLTASRQRNSERGITGYLLYLDDVFIQYLEGDAPDIRTLYTHIAADPRHQDIKLVAEGQVNRRLFAHWEMALNQHDCALQASLTDATPHVDTYEWLATNPSFCGNLFEAFSQAMQ